MISSIYLYDKPLFDTNEVYDIVTDNMLPIEFPLPSGRVGVGVTFSLLCECRSKHGVE